MMTGGGLDQGLRVIASLEHPEAPPSYERGAYGLGK